MKWEHFSDEGFDFTQGKTDKPLWIPLTDRLKAHLEGFARTGGIVVTDAKGRPVSYRIIAEEMRTIKKKMKHEKASYYKRRGSGKTRRSNFIWPDVMTRWSRPSPVTQALKC